MYLITFTDGSDPYIGFDDNLDKWKTDYLLTETRPGVYTAQPAAVKVYRSKITRKQSRDGRYLYEYELPDRVLRFLSEDRLNSLDALQRLYFNFQNILLQGKQYNLNMQYWHAYLNYKFFDGKLEPAVIKVRKLTELEEDEMIEAITYTELEPFVIVFLFDPDENEKYTITVLLHEMIHQFCRENDELRTFEHAEADEEAIDRGDYDEGHDAFFKDMARQHGLTMDGYKLTDEAEKVISEHLELQKRFATLNL